MLNKNIYHVFQTKAIYFPPFKKKVNIILQQIDGPCLLVAIFNSLVLKGKIDIDSGIYPSSSIIDIIESVNNNIQNLQDLINGFYVNPIFSSCTDFKEYPKFLDNLDIRMFHSMVISQTSMNFNNISCLDYNTLQAKIIELQSTNPGGDELKSLQSWNKMIRKQITINGIDSIESQMNEGEVGIYFRNFHFACIFKYLGHVHSLITCKGQGSQSCCWHSLPKPNGEFVYYDEKFILTLCKPWTQESSTSRKKISEKKNVTCDDNSDQNYCNMY